MPHDQNEEINKKAVLSRGNRSMPRIICLIIKYQWYSILQPFPRGNSGWSLAADWCLFATR